MPRTFQGRLTVAFVAVIALTLVLVTVLVVNRLDDYFARPAEGGPRRRAESGRRRTSRRTSAEAAAPDSRRGRTPTTWSIPASPRRSPIRRSSASHRGHARPGRRHHPVRPARRPSARASISSRRSTARSGSRAEGAPAAGQSREPATVPYSTRDPAGDVVRASTRSQVTLVESVHVPGDRPSPT